jgi:hypothetical protein
MFISARTLRIATAGLAILALGWAGMPAASAATSGWCDFINTKGMTRQKAVWTLQAHGCRNIVVHLRCDGEQANFGHVVDQVPGALANQRPHNPHPDKIYIPSSRRIQLWVGVKMNGPTGQQTSTRCPGQLAPPQVSDLNGNWQGDYTPTWEFDDVTTKNVAIPISFSVANGQVTSGSGATGSITWQTDTGVVAVSFPISTATWQGTCSGTWQFRVDAQHHATLDPAGLECRGSNVYNTGSVTAAKV